MKDHGRPRTIRVGNGPEFIYVIPIILVLCSFTLFSSHLFYHDDSYITLRYAQRLLDGKGLTWNDGERVEGFTSFLWLIQNAFLGYTGIDLESGSRYLGLAYYLAILLILILSKVPTLCLIPLMTLPSLNIYAMSGMETVSFCFWILAGTILLTREIERDKTKTSIRPNEIIRNLSSGKTCVASGLLFAAGGLTRPEGVLVGILVLSYLFAAKMVPRAILFLLGFIPPVFGYQLFRVLYFHDFLPNTYYAKSAHVAKAILLKSTALSLAKWSYEWTPIAILILLVLRRESIKKYILPLIVAFPIFMAYFAGGGDHFTGIRIILPAIVVLGYAAGHRLEARLISLGRGVFTVAVMVSLYQLFLSTVLWQRPIFPLTFGLKPREEAACLGQIEGRFLEKNLPPGTLVAINPAGALPYFAPSLSFIDMLGLNDRIIAKRDIRTLTTVFQRKPGHFKGDGAYVISRRPDAIILGPHPGILKRDDGRLFLSDYEILRDVRFQRLYYPYQLDIPITDQQKEEWEWYALRRFLESGHYSLTLWLRKDSDKVDSLRNIGAKIDIPPFEIPPLK